MRSTRVQTNERGTVSYVRLPRPYCLLRNANVESQNKEGTTRNECFAPPRNGRVAGQENVGRTRNVNVELTRNANVGRTKNGNVGPRKNANVRPRQNENVRTPYPVTIRRFQG